MRHKHRHTSEHTLTKADSGHTCLEQWADLFMVPREQLGLAQGYSDNVPLVQVLEPGSSQSQSQFPNLLAQRWGEAGLVVSPFKAAM